jgi:hypothetical protein
MKHAVYHIIIPAIMPVLFLIIAATPVEVLGCRTRGLIVLAIVLVSGLAALGPVMIGARRRMKAVDSVLWLGSTLILVAPVIALLILA